MHNFCSCYVKKFKVTNLTFLCICTCSYKYPNVHYTCMPFIYIDVHLKTILAVSLFGLVLFYEGCARGSCVRIWSLLQDCLPVKFQDVKFKDPKFMKFS